MGGGRLCGGLKAVAAAGLAVLLLSVLVMLLVPSELAADVASSS